MRKPLDFNVTIDTAAMREIMQKTDDDILPKLRKLEDVVEDIIPKLEVAYARFAVEWVTSNTANIIEASSNAIKFVLQECQIDNQQLITWTKDIISMQEHFGNYHDKVVVVLEKVKIPGLHKVLGDHKPISAIDIHIADIVSEIDNLFMVVYKFPVAIVMYKTGMMNTQIKRYADSDFSSDETDIVFSFLAFQETLRRFSRSTEIAWVTSRGKRIDSCIIDDEDHDQIVSLLNEEA